MITVAHSGHPRCAIHGPSEPAPPLQRCATTGSRTLPFLQLTHRTLPCCLPGMLPWRLSLRTSLPRVWATHSPHPHHSPVLTNCPSFLFSEDLSVWFAFVALNPRPTYPRGCLNVRRDALSTHCSAPCGGTALGAAILSTQPSLSCRPLPPVAGSPSGGWFSLVSSLAVLFFRC